MSPSYRDRRSEIDAFKELNLSVVASNFGYRIVKKKSTRHSVLMDSGNDKIIISKNGKHYVYCSVFDSASQGTIIDFVQRVVSPRCSLGEVRKILRPFLDRAFFTKVQSQNSGKYSDTIRPSTTDLMAVAARFSSFEPITQYHDYLCGERGIPIDLLLSDRLKGRVKHCPKTRAAIFPHWGSPDDNPDNPERCVTGYEIKGPGGVTRFSKGGRKSLWSSAGFPGDRTLVFAESAIDALSYLALHPSKTTRIMSLSGQINSHQPELIRSAIENMEEGAEIVAAFDNDEGGAKLMNTFTVFSKKWNDFDMRLRNHFPCIRGGDWNSQLKSARFSTGQMKLKQ